MKSYTAPHYKIDQRRTAVKGEAVASITGHLSPATLTLTQDTEGNTPTGLGAPKQFRGTEF